MTYEEADRLITILAMNYAAFMPMEPQAAAVKKGQWTGVLKDYEYKTGLKAIKDIMGSLQYPPTMYDLKMALGYGSETKIPQIEGPTFATEEGRQALYTADMDRVDKLMAELDAECARGFTKTREEAVAENDRRSNGAVPGMAI